MFWQAAGNNVDGAKYVTITTKAIEDLGRVFKKHIGTGADANVVYRKYINTMPDVSERNHPCMRCRERLVEDICSLLSFNDSQGVSYKGFNVVFRPLSPQEIGLDAGYVTWLLAGFNDHTLTFIYDPAVFTDKCDGPFEQDKALAKAFLHECGHASIHLQDIFDKWVSGQEKYPRLLAKHEQEAWIYSLAIWGALVSDLSYSTAGIDQRGDGGWRHS